jgi:hypothetical protein
MPAVPIRMRGLDAYAQRAEWQASRAGAISRSPT